MLRIAFSACLALVLSGVLTGGVLAAPLNAPSGPKVPGDPKIPKTARNENDNTENVRVVLEDVPNDIVPTLSNMWKCACDTDGCWPGCFTVASATILKYWAGKGFPNLWNGDENGTLARLRGLFPNLFCYNNVDGDGKPSDSGYDAFSVAKGFDLFVTEQGYKFVATPVIDPAFEQIVEQIDLGRPIIGAFGISPWGSHAGTIIGYDTTGGRRVMIVRPNLLNKPDTELEWGSGYSDFGMVTVAPREGQTTSEAATLSYEIVVNDADAGFTSQGEWQVATEMGFNGEARSRMTTDPSNLGPTEDTAWVRWTPQLPFDGLWEVQAWLPKEDTDDSMAHVATYRVSHAEGMSLVRRGQHGSQPGWISLGIFPFVQGDKGFVHLGDITGDNPPRSVWADGVKFSWRAPLVVQAEDDGSGQSGPPALVVNGKQRAIPDPQTFDVLRLSRSYIRKLPALQLAQYPDDQPMPSVFSAWIGQYYNNTLLSVPATTVRADSSLNFQWNGVAPAGGMGSRDFSVRWSRYFALTEGAYPFRIEAVGGVRLWVDGKLEIDAWEAQDSVYLAHDRTVPVTAGLHRVDVEYVNRDGSAQISFGNLPPNAPIVIDSPSAPKWTTSDSVTLRWSDAGDPDTVGTDRPRKFFVTIWRDDGWRAESGWISTTEWAVTLPADGRYHWSVVASDGTANSDSTLPRTILVDRTAPWAQMQDATSSVVSGTLPLETQSIDNLRLVTDASGQLVVAEAPADAPTPPEKLAALAEAQQAGQQFDVDAPVASQAITSSVLGNLPALRLSWWAQDSPSETAEGLTYDVQAREIVHAQTTYTVSVEMRDVTHIGYELVLSGTEEITNPVVLTETLPYTTVTPLMAYTPITPTEWITFATGLVYTETLFIGNPGSTYEFRVRAVDAAGNAQQWFDGYSIQAQIDPRTAVNREYMPLVYK
jgi:hypothetical protein